MTISGSTSTRSGPSPVRSAARSRTATSRSSLGPYFLPKMWDVHGFSMGVNYGCEKVRFPAPVPVGAKVRCGATVDEVEEIAGGAQVKLTLTFECEGAPKPSCVAQVVYRYYELGRRLGGRADRAAQRLAAAARQQLAVRRPEPAVPTEQAAVADR